MYDKYIINDSFKRKLMLMLMLMLTLKLKHMRRHAGTTTNTEEFFYET